MSWAKFDDQYPDHPKIVQVGPLGLALHTAATCYCARYLTDGFVPQAMISRLISFDGIYNANNNAVTNKEVTDELIRVGLLEVVPGGYQVHDYLEYNPPAAQVKAERAANKKRQDEYKARQKNNGVNNALQTTPRTRTPLNLPKQKVPVKRKVKEERETPPPDASLFPLAQAIATVCGMDMGLNRGMIFKEAKLLNGKTTPDYITTNYGKGGGWYRLDWRGKKGELPTPSIIRQTLGSINGNGNAPEPVFAERY